ncbi:hypothetical protein EYY89_20880 [Hafnia paralvei]|uniref:Uncharacterized protein n=1 Tax=Hafnia paralvei TaxID=546367 RepID=A0A4Q9EDA1_9GAMM|nr:hypothetical protein EYY89_20880 [Hafnia paralvei]
MSYTRHTASGILLAAFVIRLNLVTHPARQYSVVQICSRRICHLLAVSMQLELFWVTVSPVTENIGD